MAKANTQKPSKENKAEWVNGNNVSYSCSNCNETIWGHRPPRCPNCGAIMKNTSK